MILPRSDKRQVTFELISREKLSSMLKKDKGAQSLVFVRGEKHSISYYDEQKIGNLMSRIEDFLSEQCEPPITTQFRVYIFNPFLFKMASYQRIIEYYFLKQDMKNIASAEQKQFYEIISYKKHDEFVVEAFPGRQLRQRQTISEVLTKNNHLIVQYDSQGSWVFPQQPKWSVVKRCHYCRLIGQLYVKFECKQCQSLVMFCSRVCHYQSLMNHPCEEAKNELKILYGQDYLGVPTNTDPSKPIELAKTSKDVPTSQESKDSSNNKPFKSQDIRKRAPIPIINNSPIQSTIKTNVSVKGRGGIQNIGNSCYMNSSIQMISRTILGDEIGNIKRFGKDQKVVKAYSQLLGELKQASPSRPVLWEKAEKFKDIIDGHINDFLGYNQHDAHEFLTVFLDRINEQTKKIFRGQFPKETKCTDDKQLSACRQWFSHLRHNNSLITRLFYGQQLQETRCPYCHHKSITFAPFNSISCSIPASHQAIDFELYHESYKWRSKIAVLKVAASGLADELIEKIKNIGIIPAELRNNIKFFVSGFQTQLIECKKNSNLPDMASSKKNPQERQLFLFESPYPQARVLTIKFVDEKQQPFTFKRPFFFPASQPLTNRDLYLSIKQYLFSVYKHSEAVQFEAIKQQLEKQVEKFFTLTVYSQGKLDKEENVVFPHKGKQLNNEFSSIESPQTDSIVEVWVRLKSGSKINSDLHYIFSQGIINRINKCAQDNSLILKKDLNISSKGISLIQCLKEEYNKETILDQGNQWFCRVCQQKRRASQKTGLYKTGKYLLIQIKRFRRGLDGTFFEKNNTKIDVPPQLSLEGLLENPTLPENYYSSMSSQQRALYYLPDVDSSSSFRYRLKGVILHTGTTKLGHYKVLCKLQDEWWEFEDSRSKPVDIFKRLSSPSIQQMVYIMLYERISK